MSVDYGIYVIEQNGTGSFNRAMLFNIGASEAMKSYSYDCFIFHDVDLLPEDDRNIYRYYFSTKIDIHNITIKSYENFKILHRATFSCPGQPRHMSAYIDKFHYKLPYTDIFGGVSAISVEHYKKVILNVFMYILHL